MPTRGQTSVDFAVAMAILLVALVSAVAFLPLMTGPFTDLGGETTLVADRTVDQLVDYQLASDDSLKTLNATCTVYFFESQPADPCPTFDSDSDLRTKLGLESGIHVNVTIEQNVTGGAAPDILCADDDPALGDVTNPPCATNEVALAAGDPPSDQRSVAEARRMVRVDGRQDVFVRVRIWK
jgi:hypothetical protein